MKKWIVSYILIGNNEVSLARLNAAKWSEAMDKARNVIKFINTRNAQYNQQFELVGVTSFESLEEWED